MEPGPRVRRLSVSDRERFRALRLEALTTDPRAFGSNYERERAYPAEKWEGWVTGGASGTDQATFLAVDGSGDPFGMVGVFSHEGSPHIWGMWVRPDHRGQGWGKTLLAECLRWVEGVFPGQEVFLEVNPEEKAAVRTYLRSGFAFNGISQPLGHWDPPQSAHQMVRKRRDSSAPG